MSAQYITAAHLITGRPGEVIEHGAVCVEGGRIVAAGPVDQVPRPPDPVAAVHFEGATLLPGLIDAHVHLTIRRGESTVGHMTQVSDEMALLRGVQTAGRVLRAGVTTVRDCGTRGRLAQALRDGVQQGLISGPRILASGPPVTTTAGHLWALGYESDTADEIRQSIRRLVKEGADFIKICATGGGMTPGSVNGRAQYSVDELRAAVAEAHRLGRHVAAHVHGTEGIARAVAAQVDTLEHCTWLDWTATRTEFDEDVVREMAAHHLVADIASSPPREFIDAAWRPDGTEQIDRHGPASALTRWKLAQRMQALGVDVCFSTDAIPGWWDDGHDLSYLAQSLVEVAGYDPLDVLRMITAVPARAIGLGDTLGTIETGRMADLLVVDGNPVAEIKDLHRVRAVYQTGTAVVP